MFDAAAAAAPESMVEGARKLADGSCAAWIMFNSGDYGVTYSVGDTYTPDSLTPGVVPADAEITGAGTSSGTICGSKACGNKDPRPGTETVPGPFCFGSRRKVCREAGNMV